MSASPAIATLVPDSIASATIPAPSQAGADSAARRTFAHLTDRRADDHGVLLARGHAALEVNDAATARAWFEAAHARDPSCIDALCSLGLATQAQGDLDTAERSYRDALARAPALLVPAVRLGAMLAACSRFDEAVAVLWTAHGAICDDATRPRIDDDLVVLNELRRLCPREPGVLLALGRAHAALGHDDVARACYLRLQRMRLWSGAAMAGLVGLETPVAARPWP